MSRGAIGTLILALGAAPGEVSWQPLFQLIRNKNANVVEYGARIAPDGLLDSDRPVDAVWILKATDGRREGLNLLERNHAYGLSWKPERPREIYEVTLVCCKDRGLTVQKRGDRYEADTSVGGAPSRLVRIVVTADESSIPPKVQSVELYGVTLSGNGPIYERITPH